MQAKRGHSLRVEGTKLTICRDSAGVIGRSAKGKVSASGIKAGGSLKII